MDSAHAVQGDVDDAGLLSQGLQDGLADPPDRIGDELELLGLVEALGGPDQSEVALVDEIRHGKALVLVIPADRHHELEVRVDQLVEGPPVPLADAHRQVRLLTQGKVTGLPISRRYRDRPVSSPRNLRERPAPTDGFFSSAKAISFFNRSATSNQLEKLVKYGFIGGSSQAISRRGKVFFDFQS